MIYLLIRINGRKQLAKINNSLVSAIEEYTEKQTQTGTALRIKDMESNDCLGFYEYEGRDKKILLKQVIKAGLSIVDFLSERDAELFGYNLLISENRDLSSAEVYEYMKNTIIRIEEENSLWIDSSLLSIAEEFTTLDKVKSSSLTTLWKVTGIDLTGEQNHRENRLKYIKDYNWVREDGVERVLDALTPRLNGMDKKTVPYVFGYRGVGKTEIVYEAVKKILGRDETNPWIRLFSIFKSSSPIHPFLNSIRSDVFEYISEYLLPHERKVFDEIMPLFREFTLSRKKRMNTIIPDHIVEDFFLAYHLYVLAFIRMMEEKNLPAVFVCDDVDLYNSESRRFLLSMMHDFSEYEVFVPLFVSSDKVILKDLESMELRKVYIAPLSRYMIKELALKVDEKLILSEKLLRKIRRITKGLYSPVLHCLLYLEFSENDNLPDSETCSRYLSNMLDPDQKKVLHSLYISRGILKYTDQLHFIVSLGYSERDGTAIVNSLRNFGFVEGKEYILPDMSGLKNVPNVYNEVIEKFVEYLTKKWEAFEYTNYVLLFYFFLKLEKFKLAGKVYHAIIQRKLNERDLTGIDNFLKESRWKQLLSGGSERNSAGLETAMLLYRIDQLGLSGRFKEAYSLYMENRDQIDNRMDLTVFPDSDITIAGLNIALKNVEESLSLSKHALLKFQSLNNSDGMRASYIKLGRTMLARGKLDDALEYFLLAGRISGTESALDSISIVVLSAITRFIQGDLSDALLYCDEALKITPGTFSREWEVFIYFLKARFLFEIGLYDGCIAVLEKTLSYLSLYKIEKAEKVVYAWLARAFIYGGSVRTGLEILDHMEKSQLNLLFTAEGCYMTNEYEKASGFMEDGGIKISGYDFLPGDRIFWLDGFYSVEGRCLDLSDSMLKRISVSFLSYMYYLSGNSEKSINGFQDILHGKIPDFDPYMHYYYFLYSECLGENRFTMLNRAWNTLQERANRISSPEIKRKFMESNYWNKRILKSARDNKLI
ncbi:MAG: ATP-binding protein [Spirochaetes bacterium]|nr:ATP-binding protein [Spirochaetota bacterium]